MFKRCLNKLGMIIAMYYIEAREMGFLVLGLNKIRTLDRGDMENKAHYLASTLFSVLFI